MLQIIASANSVYDIPWPTSFSAFMDVMKLFQVDLLTVTKANCTVRLDYYQSLLLTLLLFKVSSVAGMSIVLCLSDAVRFVELEGLRNRL